MCRGILGDAGLLHLVRPQSYLPQELEVCHHVHQLQAVINKDELTYNKVLFKLFRALDLHGWSAEDVK